MAQLREMVPRTEAVYVTRLCLTKCTGRSLASESKNTPASQEIPNILRNLKSIPCAQHHASCLCPESNQFNSPIPPYFLKTPSVAWSSKWSLSFRSPTKNLYRNHTSPQIVPILSHIIQVEATPTDSLKIHFNIILLSRTMYSKWPLPLRSAHQNPVQTFSLTRHVPRACSSYSSRIRNPNNIWSVAQIITLLAVQRCPVTVNSLLLCPNIFLSTLFSSTLSVCYSFNIRDFHIKLCNRYRALCMYGQSPGWPGNPQDSVNLVWQQNALPRRRIPKKRYESRSDDDALYCETTGGATSWMPIPVEWRTAIIILRNTAGDIV